MDVSLLQGICKNQRMDMLIQKSTELGVRAIRPLSCRRSVVRIDEDRVEKRLRHWQGIAASACEQSGRAVVPRVFAPETLVFVPAAGMTEASRPVPGSVAERLIAEASGSGTGNVKPCSDRSASTSYSRRMS